MKIDIDRNIIDAAADKAEYWLREWAAMPDTASKFNQPIAAGNMVDFMRALSKARERLARAEGAATQWKPDPQIMSREFAADCAKLARWIKPTAPKHIKELAAGWLEDDERDAGPEGRS